jgi:hypothetical protein
MSTIFTPGRSIASTSTSNSTHASTITTTHSHGLISGDVIHIAGQTADPQINGLQTVDTIVSPTVFITAFNSNLINGTGNASGTVTVSRKIAVTIPSDGDGPGIASADVNTPIQGIGEQVADLLATRGGYALVSVLQTVLSGNAATLSSGNNLISSLTPGTVQIGDIVETEIAFTVYVANSSSSVFAGYFSLWESFAGGAAAKNASSEQHFSKSVPSNNDFTPIMLKALTVVGPSNIGTVGAYAPSFYW